MQEAHPLYVVHVARFFLNVRTLVLWQLWDKPALLAVLCCQPCTDIEEPNAMHMSLKVKQDQITVHLQYFSIVWFHGAETARCIESKLGQTPLSQIKPYRFWCCENHNQLIFQEVHKHAAWQDLSLIRYHCSLGISGEKNTKEYAPRGIQHTDGKVTMYRSFKKEVLSEACHNLVFC